MAIIIDLENIRKKLQVKKFEAETRVDLGIEALEKLSPEERKQVVEVAAYAVAGQVGVGLGLFKWEEISPGTPEPELRYYNLIDGLYQQHLSKCWFCDPDTDPDKKPFGNGTPVCGACRKKLRSFGFGISKGKLDLSNKF